MPRCLCTTRYGDQCRNSATAGDVYCAVHKGCTRPFSSSGVELPRTSVELPRTRYQERETLSPVEERGKAERRPSIGRQGVELLAQAPKKQKTEWGPRSPYCEQIDKLQDLREREEACKMNADCRWMGGTLQRCQAAPYRGPKYGPVTGALRWPANVRSYVPPPPKSGGRRMRRRATSSSSR